MVQEIEQKLRILDDVGVQSLQLRCGELAMGKKTVVDQRDEYYDTVDEQLRHGDFTVRVRQEGLRTLVALKGTRVYEADGVSRRIELELEVSDRAGVRAQLERQGLVRTAVIDKRRREFLIQDCVVAIDTVPFIGSFVEIEGPRAEAIKSVRESLGLHAATAESKNYTELVEEELLSIGRPIRPRLVATFDAEAFHSASVDGERR